MTKNRFVLAIALSILGLASSLATIQLQPASSNVSTPEINYQDPDPPLDDNRAPGDRKGGGTRDGDNCKAPLMALVPAIQIQQTEALDIRSQTTKESPALWFYVPYLPEFVTLAEFDLQDADGNSLYRKEIDLSGTPGIIRVDIPSSLPATGKSLEIGQMYKWYFYLDIDCKVQRSYSSEVYVNVNGWLERVRRPDLEQKLTLAKSDLERAAVYAGAGIWQDALTLLAERYRHNPGLAEVWTKFLGQARWELEPKTIKEEEVRELLSADLVSCCALEENSFQEDTSSLYHFD